MAKYLFIIGAGASKAINSSFPTGAELIEELKKLSSSLKARINHKPPSLTNFDIINFSNLTLAVDGSYILTIYRAEDNIDKKYILLDDVTKRIPFDEVHLLDLLITELIAKFKPESIDYFVQEDIKTKLSNYVAQATKLRLLKVGEGADELETKVSTRIKERIVEILTDLTFEDYTNTWVCNILVNKIRLNSAKDVKFITFNYDLNIENIVKEIAKTDGRITSMPKVEHVYGNLADGIHLMERKSMNYGEEFLNAESIYFIGYGFDDLNNKNLGLKENAEIWKDKKIFIHNYGGNSALEYKASSIFKANFEFTREESRRFIDFERNLFIFISEKEDINKVLSNDFFFEK